MRILLLIVLVTTAVPRNTITLSIIPEFVTNKKIKILSDFTSESDKKFFESTFPWLAINFPNLQVEYYFKDGEIGGKRMCVVKNTKNLQWQADFLQCQAKGKEDCKEKKYVQQRAYNRCTQSVYLQMRDAANAFKKYKPLYTPFIVDGWSRITTEDPMAILEKMCEGFSWVEPEGCKQPSPLPDSDKSKDQENKDGTDPNAKPVPEDCDAKEKPELSKVKGKDKSKDPENKDGTDPNTKPGPEDSDAKEKPEPSKVKDKDKSKDPENKDGTDPNAKPGPEESDAKEKPEPSKVKDKDSNATKDSGDSVAAAVVTTA